MLPLIVALRESERFRPIVISTGQHAAMVEEVLAIGDVVPDVTFDLPPGPRTLNDLFAQVVDNFGRYFTERFGSPLSPEEAPYASGYPAAAFVHGDTSRAAAAALAAFHVKLPIVHVEAGLRTSNTLSPFPEELNRQLISRIAAFHLAPTTRNKANLMREGIDYGRIFVTGNTAIDALQLTAARRVPFADPRLSELDDPNGPKVVVVTAHRRENWGAPLERIATAVGHLAESHPDVRFVVSLHPNPAVADTLTAHLAHIPNVLLTSALGYAEFARLLARATVALTDSGGIQEEAPSLGTPVICVRETTERQEGVDAGTVELVGTDTDRIVTAVSRLLDDELELSRRAKRENPYGDGQSAVRIVRALEHIVYESPAPVPFGAGFDRTSILGAGGSADPVAAGWTPAWSQGTVQPGAHTDDLGTTQRIS
jgi:UDP-N-acetylglucosamine 2-epimerase (non-hydrolysing)